MLLESILAYLHFITILALVVFLTSEAALCRVEWMNAAVVHRLVRLDVYYLCAAIAVLLSGVARTLWGMKGVAFYWHQPLLHAKLGVFVVIGLMSLKPTMMFMRWRKDLNASGALPAEHDVRSARRWIMVEAHLLIVIPLFAAFLARSIGIRLG